MKLTKYRKRVKDKVDRENLYTMIEASNLIKELINVKFDPSVDLHIRLGVDPRQADQALRGTVSLPHGSGKEKKVLVLCTPDKEQEAKDAGADHVGLDEYIEKIQGGWLDIDVVIATPSVMPKIARLGKVLGPRNLMPNPKSGTVSNEIADAVKEIKKGKISFRVDKYGIVHTSIGRGSFTPEQIKENAAEMINTLAKMKPASAKGTYFKSVVLASTMSPGIKIDHKSVTDKEE